MLKMMQRGKLRQLVAQSAREQARQVRCNTGRTVYTATRSEAVRQAEWLNLFRDAEQTNNEEAK